MSMRLTQRKRARSVFFVLSWNKIYNKGCLQPDDSKARNQNPLEKHILGDAMQKQ